jgi:hypothetical protein
MDNTYISQVINTREIKVRDFNHDDHLDLILYGAVGQLFIGDGTGKLTAINQDITLEGDMGNVSLVTEDINADSHLDLIVSCSGINKNNIDVYSGDGTGGFISTGLEYGLPYINGGLCAGDFNKDGNLDLAVAHPDTNQVGILFGLKGLIHDIALLSIESPAGRIPIDSSVTPQVNVINKGRETESFQIKFQIEELYNETIDANLNPDEQKLITFPSWTPDQRGIFEINCNILFAEDQNSSNNFLESQITVIGDSTEPDIFLIKPNRGGNTGWITTTIIGANFQEGVIIKLIKEGQEDIIADSCAFQNSEVISSSEIQAIFNLKGSETGLWDLEIINPGGSNIIASEIFQIENGEQKVWVDIIGPDEILLGETTAFSLYIGNSGNINVDYLVPMLTLPQEVDLDSITSFNENRTLIYGDTLLAYDLDMLEIPFFIRNLPPDKVAAFTLYVRGNTRASLSKLNNHKKLDKPSASPSFGWSGIILSTIECVAKNAAKNGITEPRSENNWNKAVIDGVENLAEGLAIEVITIAIEILYPPSIPFIEGIKVLDTFISGAKDVGQFLEVSNASKPFGIVSSFDPNLKVGPSGFGSQGYILDDRPFHYRIYFENVDTATASAKNIYLIDTLDSDFDISTIEFGETSHPVTNIELDSSQGIINWTFSEIYLPPNVNPPEGEGWVSFSIHPKPNLPSGTYITNRASIVFDYNEPILTPMLTNVIDKEPPISTFNSLPLEQEHLAFKIDWAGTDSESGVAWYQIYKSENGGDYKLWTQTPDNSAIFIGKNENFYSFYSVAIDNVGNVETSPMSSIANTYIKAKENIAVNPNPFVPARGHEKITFFGGGVANARIKIYDKAGYLVKTLDEINGEKKLEWDATNENGRKLASGVYIWVLAGSGEKDKGKFAIIR